MKISSLKFWEKFRLNRLTNHCSKQSLELRDHKGSDARSKFKKLHSTLLCRRKPSEGDLMKRVKPVFSKKNAWFTRWIIFEKKNFGRCGVSYFGTKDHFKRFFKQYQVLSLQPKALQTVFSVWNRNFTYEQGWLQTSRYSYLESNFLKFEIKKVLIWQSNNWINSAYACVMFLISTSTKETKLTGKDNEEFAERYETKYLQYNGVVEQAGLRCSNQNLFFQPRFRLLVWKKEFDSSMVVIKFVVTRKKISTFCWLNKREHFENFGQPEVWRENRKKSLVGSYTESVF